MLDLKESMLDWPTELSYGIGRSIVPPIRSEFPVGSPGWCAETEVRMQRLSDRARGSRQWFKFVFLHVHEHRWRALDEVSPFIPAHSFPRLFRKVWIDSENIFVERRRVSRLIELIRPEFQKMLFKAADRRRFESLPDRFTIYRGAKDWNLRGMSWTLDLHRAVYFATHHNEDGMPCSLPPERIGVVMERTIQKSEVSFYTNDRREDEVVLKRFAKGPLSPEGVLWTAEWRGPEAFAAEFEKQKEFLSSEAVAGAQGLLALMNSLEQRSGWAKRAARKANPC